MPHFLYVCVCVCVCVPASSAKLNRYVLYICMILRSREAQGYVVRDFRVIAVIYARSWLVPDFAGRRYNVVYCVLLSIDYVLLFLFTSQTCASSPPRRGGSPTWQAVRIDAFVLDVPCFVLDLCVCRYLFLLFAHAPGSSPAFAGRRWLHSNNVCV